MESIIDGLIEIMSSKLTFKLNKISLLTVQ